LSIIPQEPTLFIGTVRDNLDPVHAIRKKLGKEAAEEAMWAALRRVELDEEIRKRWREYLSKDLETAFSLPSGFQVDKLQEARAKFDQDAKVAKVSELALLLLLQLPAAGMVRARIVSTAASMP